VPISDIKKLTLFSVGMWRRRYNQPESKERMPQLTIEKFRVQPALPEKSFLYEKSLACTESLININYLNGVIRFGSIVTQFTEATRIC
jgi:hypothetical protein